MTTNTDTDTYIDDDSRQPPAPVESAACFFAKHDECTSSDCPCDCHRRQKVDPATAIDIVNETVEHGHYASLATVRCAIADVLDDGYDLGDQGHHRVAWLFFRDESDEQTELREKFLDAVVQRIAQLQSPPHGMDAGLQALVERAEKVLTRRGRR